MFSVRTALAPSRAGDVRTVIATRPGISDRRIVVLANRDAPGLAGLSGTAALLELARVFKTRELEKTLVLVSTTGATTGFAGARAWARDEAGEPVDGVIVLGDVAGTGIHKPWVVSWPSSSRPPALGLERTVQAAVRRETRSDAGGPRAVGQWFRRALPVTLSAQGPIGDEGLPAVLISISGEPGPAADTPVRESHLGAFGRAAVRAVGAVDAAGPRDGPAFAGAPAGIVTLRNVLPEWGVRLVVGSLLLPALLAALDAFFRARRRHVPIARWIAWLAVAAVPLPVAWLWLRMLGATGAIDVPDGPAPPASFPFETSGIVALASAALAAALACWGARLAVRAWWARPRGAHPASNGAEARREPAVPGVEGLAVATAAWICALAAVTWVFNPYAAGLLVPAAHLWLFAAAGGWRLGAGLVALAVGLAPPALALAHLTARARAGPARDGVGRCARGRRRGRQRLGAAARRAAGRVRRHAAGAAGPTTGRAGRGPARRADQHPRAGHVRGPGLARRHGVRAAAMSKPRKDSSWRAVRR